MRGMGYETPERAEDSLARIARALERIAGCMERSEEDGAKVKAMLEAEFGGEGERWGASRSSTATPQR